MLTASALNTAKALESFWQKKKFLAVIEQKNMLFDERQILLNGESVCEEHKCQHEETKKCTFLLKALLCLASDTWVFTGVGCSDTDIYMRL